jgi:hypothetical protein
MIKKVQNRFIFIFFAMTLFFITKNDGQMVKALNCDWGSENSIFIFDILWSWST